jgi:hypothetical protein
MSDEEPIAYVYQVVPDNPDWAKRSPAFEPHWSVTFEHPDKRFENMSGVKAIDVTPLYDNE